MCLRLILVWIVISVGTACSDETPAQEQVSGEPSDESEGESSGGETVAEGGPVEGGPVEGEPEAPIEDLAGVPEEELQEEMENLEETVREAVEEASAAEVGSTYCESAYAGLAAMIERVSAQYPDDTRPMPPRTTFMNVCQRLSPEAQQCLLPTYATANREECAAVAAAMPAEDQRRLKEMLRGE